MYDTPIGVGGKIDTSTGAILSGPMAGQQASNSGTVTRYTDPAASASAPLVKSPIYNGPTIVGYSDQFGQAPSRYGETLSSPYGATTFSSADENSIRNNARSQAQAGIDAINEMMASELASARQRGEERLGETRALGAATGVIGAPRGNAQLDNTRAVNAAEENAIRAAAATKLAGINDNINSRGDQLVQAAKGAASQNADKYVALLKAHSDNALTDMKQLAAAGAELTPNQRNKLISQTGYDATTFDQLYKSYQVSNDPTIINKDKPQIVGDQAVFFKHNPDGTISSMSIALPPSSTGKTVTTAEGVMAEQSDGSWRRVGTPNTGSGAPKAAGVGDTVQTLAEALVNGQLAPAELSKRSSGVGNMNQILAAANKYSQDTYGKPFNIATADRNYKYATNVQTQNTLNYLGSLVGSNGGSGNLDDLKSLSGSIKRTSFPALNSVAAWARLESGDPSMASYHAVLTEVADQVAKILQGGGTGSGTSDAKLAQASALFQSSFSKAQIDGVVTSLKPLLMNRAKNIIGNNPYLSDYADGFGFEQKGAGSGIYKTGSATQTTQQRAADAGYDYDAMRADGASDEEINAALDQAGS